jgi:hypothetical protein
MAAELTWNDINVNFIRNFVGDKFDYGNLNAATKDEMTTFLEARGFQPVNMFQQFFPAQQVQAAVRIENKLRVMGNNDTIDSYLKYVDADFAVNGTPEGNKIPALLRAVNPKIAEQIAMKISSNPNIMYADLCGQLMAQFQQTGLQRWDNFRHLKKLSNETYLAFGRRLKEELMASLSGDSKMQPAGINVIDQMLTYLFIESTGPSMQMHLRTQLGNQPQPSYEEILISAGNHESLFRKDFSAKNHLPYKQKETTPKREDQDFKPVCFKCGEQGHYASRCTNRRSAAGKAAQEAMEQKKLGNSIAELR